MNRGIIISLLIGTSFAGASPALAADVTTATDVVAASDSSAADTAAAVAEGAQPAPDAASQPAATESNDWEGNFMPYLWIAGTKGTIGIPKGDDEVSIDKSFVDVLGSLKFAFMGAFDIRHKRFVMLSDVIYISVGADAKGIHDPQFFKGRVDASTFVGSAAAGYRLVDQGPMYLDVFAGARAIGLHAKVKLEGPLTTREASKSATTIAPLVGARFRAPIGRLWAIELYGDAGGLVKGSDVKWQAMADIQHDLSSRWRLVAGYRYMSINHDNNRFDFDINLSGPFLGVNYRF